MLTIRIWTVESDYDAKAVGCLANKLLTHLKLKNLSIRESGKRAIPKNKKVPPSETLRMAVQNYLKQDSCVIFVIDRDGPMSDYQRRQEPNSLINQIERITKDNRFTGKVFLAPAVQEVEAWLLIDCLGIFCCFANKVAQYKGISRDKVSNNQRFTQLISRHQKGNTENIVEAEMGGNGAKEYLIKFSEEILHQLNPNMPRKNIDRNQYKESMSPEVAEHVTIDQHTLRRNDSLRHLENLLAQCQQVE